MSHPHPLPRWADVVALHPHTLQLQQVIVEGEAL